MTCDHHLGATIIQVPDSFLVQAEPICGISPEVDPLSPPPSSTIHIDYLSVSIINILYYLLHISCACVFPSSFSTVPYCSYTHFDRR